MLMKAKNIPNNFGGEAVRHATCIINRTPIRALIGATLFKKFNGEKPNLEDLKVYLDDRSRPLVYFGKEPNSGRFRLYDPKENKIIISTYEICDENKTRQWSNELENQDRNGLGTFTVLWSNGQAT
uniref:Retroviral polymerase SH3-like domain-containing protein n=1 Tax=Lactuca sativa TaxID=4236 RepID=A0A9R1XD99_LACSA|nr:hypothetical protein LSAT_V11C500260040 [Lactuca sativa]